MNADEIVRILREEYGVLDAADLDRRIREQEALDITFFNRRLKEERAS